MREQRHETRAKKAKLAISYITTGTLMMVWSLIWLLYLTLPGNISGATYIACGVILSGLAVVIIGMKVGNIGKEANQDEPEDGDNAVAGKTQANAIPNANRDPVVNPLPPQPIPQDVELDRHQTT